MPKVYRPQKREWPDPGPGYILHQLPFHELYMTDPGYYDSLDRDPFQRHKIWFMLDSSLQVEKLREILPDYPSVKHRRLMMFTTVKRGKEELLRVLLETGVSTHPDIEAIRRRKAEKEKRVKGEVKAGGGRGESRDDGEGAQMGEDKEDVQSKDAGEGDKVKEVNKNEEEEEEEDEEEDETCSPFFAAMNLSQLGCVKICIEEAHVDVNVRDEIGRTPLIAAAHASDIEIVRYLLDRGADPLPRTDASSEVAQEYLTNFAGANALEMATPKRNVELAKLLLEHPVYGSTENRKSREGEEPGVWVTPLALRGAAMSQNPEMLELLLERGAYPTADKDGKSKRDQLSPEQRKVIEDILPDAAECGHSKSLKLVLSYLYPTDPHGNILPFGVPKHLQKPFVYGAYSGMACHDPYKFDFIYSLGVKEHDSMSLNKLPEGALFDFAHLLETACQYGSIDGAEMMIGKYGANPNGYRIPQGITPLYLAAGKDHVKMVRYLLESQKADIHIGNGRYASGPTALWVAIMSLASAYASLLLEHGGPVEHVDEEILKATEPITAVLSAAQEPRAPVRLTTVENAKKQELWKACLMVDIDPDDKDWLRNLQYRRPDDELRENGRRELNAEEAEKELAEDDPRRDMVEFAAVPDREEELEDELAL